MKPLAIVVLTLSLGPQAFAQTPGTSSSTDAPVVVTAGEGIVKRAPDRAWVTIAAESRAKTPAEVQKLNADAMSAVMQKLKGMGLPAEAIRTAAYELRPEFDYANNRQTLRGYVARNAVEVRVDEAPCPSRLNPDRPLSLVPEPPLDRRQVDGVELPLRLDRRRQLALTGHDMPNAHPTYRA